MQALDKRPATVRATWSVSRTFAAASFLFSALLVGCSSGGGTSIGLCGECSLPVPVKTATTLTLAVANSSGTTGQNTVFAATVAPAAATGTVSITDLTDTQVSNPSPIASGAVQQGVANVIVQPSNAGTRRYRADYSGDNTYAPSQAFIDVTIKAPLSASSCGLGTAGFVLGSGTASPTQTNFASNAVDDSAVCAQNLGTTLTLVSPAIVKNGVLGFYEAGDPSGVDAAVLAYGSSATTASGATINLQGTPTITASQAGYGVFASGNGATVNLSNATVNSTSANAAIGAGNNGQLNIDNSTITADRDPLTINQGGSVVLQNTSLASTYYSGSMIFQASTTGPNAVTHFRMTGGSLSSISPGTFSAEPNFVINGNETVDMYFSHVDLSKLFTASGRYFIEMFDASTLALTLDNQSASGTIQATSTSSLTLQNGSSLDGDFQGGGNVTLDASSSWTIHSSLGLQTFNDPGGISGTQVLNVTGNGQSIGYPKALNPQLGGLTYTLKGGGMLVPH